MRTQITQNKNIIICAIFISVLILFLVFFRRYGNNYADTNILYQSEQLIKVRPDSALLLLESIDFPEELEKKDYALYCQLLVATHQLNKVSIKDDTIISFAVNYYKEKPKEVDNYIKSLLLLGCVYEEQDSIDLAENIYHQVYNMSINLGDTIANAISAFELGGLYKERSNYSEAIKWFTIAYNTFPEVTERKMKFRSLRNSADCYLLSQKNDTALIIYNDILEQVAPQRVKLRADLYKNIAISYKTAGYPDKSFEFINKSIETATPDLIDPIQYIVLASIYEDIGQSDSCIYYNRVALKYAYEQNNIDLIHKIYKSAFDSEYPDKFNKYILSRSISDSIYQKQKYESIKYRKLYNIEKIKKEHKELIITSGRYLFLFILISIIAIGIYFFIVIHIKAYKKQIQQDMEDKNNIINMIRNSLYQRLILFQKMVRLSISPNKDKNSAFLKEYNKIAFGKNEIFSFSWDIAYDLCNNIFDNYATEIENLEELSEIEKKISILQKLEFSPSEIAIILEKSINTIYRYSSIIRKKIDAEDI